MKKIYKDGLWYDEYGNITEAPESRMKPGEIYIPNISKGISYFANEARAELGAEIDAHNAKREKEETEENLLHLENITKNFLKQNNLL